MKAQKYILLIIFIMLSQLVKSQMGFHNNGLKITIDSGAYVNVVDFTDSIVGDSEGTIDLSGTLRIKGNMTNNSTEHVFINIPAVPEGKIILDSTNQTIKGITPIYFENLKIINATKTLSLDTCQVKGIFTVDGVMDLNQNRLILYNGTPGAINYQSGFLKSETPPTETTPHSGLGEIEWKIGSNINTYSVPFGSGAGGNDLNFVLETKSAASPSSGSIVFATYPTDIYNAPYPPEISSLDTFAPEMADRYWELQPLYTTKPDVVLNFKYTATDVDKPYMNESFLEAIRYNDVRNTWLDMPMTGICNVADKVVTTPSSPIITGANLYTWWALSEFEFKIPNAFIPVEGPGEKNGVFLAGYNIEIFNRWDQKIYSGTAGWNGKIDDTGSMVSPGTYFYTAQIPVNNNQMATIKGVITLIAPK
ncbi:MAG: gliding motility-associated C-terminal domain-containing protein [Bacteroidales bacterium]|jgi:hypothetical protein